MLVPVPGAVWLRSKAMEKITLVRRIERGIASGNRNVHRYVAALCQIDIVVDKLTPGVHPIGHRAVVVQVLLDAIQVLIGDQVRDRAGRGQIRTVRRASMPSAKLAAAIRRKSEFAAPSVGLAMLLPTPSIGSTPCEPTTPLFAVDVGVVATTLTLEAEVGRH